MSSCSAPAPKEKKWGIKDCRERKCPELRKNKNSEYPDDEQERCQVFNTMPGALSCCIRDMDNLPPEEFLRQSSWCLYDEWEKGTPNRKTPGPKNCPEACPYKISEQGEIFGKTGEERWKKKPGTIWKCAFNGGVLGQGLGGSCYCHVLDNPEQEKQIETIRQTIFHRSGSPFTREACNVVGCPDGIVRCKAGDIICPVIKLPFIEIKACPLWRIPAKMLPAGRAMTKEEIQAAHDRVTKEAFEKESLPGGVLSKEEKKKPRTKVEKKVPISTLEKPKTDTKREKPSKKSSPKKKPKLSEYRCDTCPIWEYDDNGACKEYLSFPVDERPVVFRAIEVCGCGHHPTLLKQILKIHEKNPHREVIQEAGTRQKQLTEFDADIGPCKDCSIECPSETDGCEEFQDFVEKEDGPEVPGTCDGCEGWATCSSKDPHAGCLTEVLPVKKIRKCCPTCSHHKTRKTFEETCPRLPDLMFKGGKLSANDLMLETSLKDCEHWIPKPEKRAKKKKED